MNDNDKNLQHAMMSFALWGGMLVSERPHRHDGRAAGRPSGFVPWRPGRKD